MLPTQIQKAVLTCQICTSAYDPKSTFLRPYSLPCGHTFCLGCINANYDRGISNCSFCKVNHSKVYKINFQLEDQINAVTKLAENLKSEQNSFKKVTFCIDCKSIFRSIPDDGIAGVRTGHETIPLDNLAETKVKETIWLLDILNRGPSVHERFQQILQTILQIGVEYQQALEVLTSSWSDDPKSFEITIMDALKAHLAQDTDEKHEHWQNEITKALLKMRSIQVDLGAVNFKITRDYLLTSRKPQNDMQLPGYVPHKPAGSIPLLTESQLKEEEKLLDEMMAAIQRDSTSGLFLLPSKKHFKLLPDLIYKVVQLEGSHKSQPQIHSSGLPSLATRFGDEAIYLSKRKYR